MSRNGKIIIGLLSLVGVLLYNWTHTGGLLASYVKPEFVGYIAAAGIELAVVGLSLRIDEMRRAQADATFHVGTLAAVVIVSALANIAQGYLVKFGTELTSANIGRLDAVQVVVSLAATGLLSLVVFALSEVVGHDIGASEAQGASQGPQVAETDEIGPLSDYAGQGEALESSQTDTGSDSRAAVVENALPAIQPNEAAQIATLEHAPVTTADIILEYYKRNPDATMTQAAQHVARATGTPYSRQAVAAQLQRLEVAGRIARNGHVDVLP
ncbi:MAG: hypothetical protein IPO08_20475 [Xanthomonadales bacterium]|nr:hypothetical protein [Xanthomonadales bacterium]